jgi:pimeloyl-ACP methyl ester carboxylesterase
VRTRPVQFYSDGIRLEGLLHAPEDADGGPDAAIIVCSGYQGLKEWIPARICPELVGAGYACLAFDYRGFGTSEGERGRLLPQELVDDVKNAVTYLAQQPEIDAHRIGLAGWGFGGGIVVQAAADDRRVQAVACLNGLGHAGRVVRDGVPYAQWLTMQERIEEDRVRRVLTGRSQYVPQREMILPGTARTPEDDRFDADVSALGRAIVEEISLQSAEAYYDFRPELVVGSISPRPLFIMHGARNVYHPIDEAHSLYQLAGEPKQLIEVPGAGHLDWIHPNSPLYRPNMARVVEWFRQHLRVQPEARG